MNSTIKSFIIGRRYFLNNGTDTYFAVSDRYTASGYRYIRFRSDIHGHSYEYKVWVKDGIEFIVNSNDWGEGRVVANEQFEDAE